MNTKHDKDNDAPKGISRRSFMARGVAVGAAASAAGLGLLTRPAAAKTSGPVRVGASGFEPLEVDSPMARWKKPQSPEFIAKATRNYSFPNWQSGNEDSIYYNLNLPEFFHCSYVPPPQEFSKLERAIDPSILDLTYTAADGTPTPPLKEYLVGKRQVQAMMMAHKGKVVFEVYPGMNPTDIHIWMSASKPTVGLLVAMLADEGKIDLDKPVPTYVPEIRGSAWEQATVRNVMNMSSGLNIEETIENLLNPDSWIANWFTAGFEPNKGDFREMSKNAKPLPGESAGERFRYSGANTQTLVLATQYVSGMRWQDFWNERVWSKIGAKNPFICGLAPDGTPLAAGLHNTTPEDLLRYTLIYTPSWNVVSDEQIISDRLLKSIQTMGNPEAYKGSTEEQYGTDWFGEVPAYNSAQWDHVFSDGAMFKHGNMGQGIYVDPARDFCGMYFGLAPNPDEISGIDHSPGYLRNAAKYFAGK